MLHISPPQRFQPFAQGLGHCRPGLGRGGRERSSQSLRLVHYEPEGEDADEGAMKMPENCEELFAGIAPSR